MILNERRTALKPLAVGVASALLAMQSTGVSAASFELGGFDVSFDSTFSVGAAMRIEDRDFPMLVGKSSNQTFDWTNNQPWDPNFTTNEVWAGEGSYSTNGDNGNLNYDPGKTFSEVVKGFHELKISADTYGLVTSFFYYKDFAAEGTRYIDSANQTRFEPCRDSRAEDLLCEDLRLLDAYVWADFDFNDGANPVSIRVGEQVLSWGESTLIPHGINVTPVDISRLRAPGADLKEAFIPTGMVWANVGLTDSLSLEAFYQYRWQETWLPVAGSYFSTNDFAAEGGQYQNIQLNFASNPDYNRDTLMAGLNGLGQQLGAVQQALVAGAIDADTAAAQQANLANAYIGGYPTKYAIRARTRDVEASDSGQFGIKLGIFAEELNFTEFGLYFINYHSRRPLISGVASDFGSEAVAQDLAVMASSQANGGLTEDQLNNLNAFTKGVLVYPEDIKLYGFSFNTTIGETAISGEISYREDEPIQVDDTELLFAGMPEQLFNAGLASQTFSLSQIADVDIEGCDYPTGGNRIAPGQTANGFCRMDVAQAQFTAIHQFGPTLFLDNLTAVTEVGVVQIQDMPDPDDLRFNAPGTPRSGTVPDEDVTAVVLNGVQNGVDTLQVFPTATSWGYRVILAGEMNNILGNYNVKPRVTFAHDVNGVTPDPLYLFFEDRKSLGLSFDVSSQSNWTFGFAYNAFYGGVGEVNRFADRDYVSVNVKYSL